MKHQQGQGKEQGSPVPRQRLAAAVFRARPRATQTAVSSRNSLYLAIIDIVSWCPAMCLAVSVDLYSLDASSSCLVKTQRNSYRNCHVSPGGQCHPCSRNTETERRWKPLFTCEVQVERIGNLEFSEGQMTIWVQ